MIKAVLFDIDGVLIDSEFANWKFYCALFKYFGYKEPTFEELDKVFALDMFNAIRVLINSEDKDEIMKIWQGGRDRVVTFPNELLNFPIDLYETMEELHKEYTLGIVTSRLGKSVFELSPMNNIEKFFGIIVTASDTEKHKPDPEPILYALNKLSLKPEEVIYIDDQEVNRNAATQANTKFILYDKEFAKKGLKSLIPIIKSY